MASSEPLVHESVSTLEPLVLSTLDYVNAKYFNYCDNLMYGRFKSTLCAAGKYVTDIASSFHHEFEDIDRDTEENAVFNPSYYKMGNGTPPSENKEERSDNNFYLDFGIESDTLGNTVESIRDENPPCIPLTSLEARGNAHLPIVCKDIEIADQHNRSTHECESPDLLDIIRFTRSHECIDLINSDYTFDDHHMKMRRHSSPARLPHHGLSIKTFEKGAHSGLTYEDLGLQGTDEVDVGNEDTTGLVSEDLQLTEQVLQFSNVLPAEETMESIFSDFRKAFENDQLSSPREKETAGSSSSSSRNRVLRQRKAKKKEKMVLINKDLHSNKQSRKKFAETLEELFRDRTEEREIDDALTCPVCYEVFYNPYICRPCGHVFCEPCLRKIARINSSEKRDSPCPICRELIQYCVVDYELGLHVRSHLPEEHRQRRLRDGSGRHMSHPLPSRPNPLSVAGILRRNRQNRLRLMSPIRLDFWRFFALLLTFLLFKASLLLVVLFVFNIANSYLTGEKVHTFGSLFNSLSLKFIKRDQPKAWFWGISFMCGCVVILFTTRQLFKWARARLQT